MNNKISTYCEEYKHEANEINVYPCDICRSEFERLKKDFDLKNKILVPIKYIPSNN